jgi:hypothetical protein
MPECMKNIPKALSSTKAPMTASTLSAIFAEVEFMTMLTSYAYIDLATNGGAGSGCVDLPAVARCRLFDVVRK